MTYKALDKVLKTCPEYQSLIKKIGNLPLGGETSLRVFRPAIPLIVKTLIDLKRPLMIVAPLSEDARNFYAELLSWGVSDQSVFLFPEVEELPFERTISDPENEHQRLSTLHKLNQLDSQTVVIASAAALLQKTISTQKFESHKFKIEINQQIQINKIVNACIEMGYSVEPSVISPGSMSIRGGIVDIFPVGFEEPVRIDFWDNEIESIRFFNPIDQRSIKSTKSVSIIPCKEMLVDQKGLLKLKNFAIDANFRNCNPDVKQKYLQEIDQLSTKNEFDESNFYSGFFNTGTLMDYFPTNGLVIAIDPYKIFTASKELDRRVEHQKSVKQSRGDTPIRFASFYFQSQRILDSINEFRRLNIIFEEENLTDLSGDLAIENYIPINSPPVFFGEMGSFIEEINERLALHFKVVILTAYPQRVKEVLRENQIDPDLIHSDLVVLKAEYGSISSGFILDNQTERLVLFTDLEIFGVTKKLRQIKKVRHSRDRVLEEISQGEYIVHIDHGVGRFLGTAFSGDNKELEYLILQYSGNDRLYVPMEHLDRVTPYIAAFDHAPKLTRLGTKEWIGIKTRAEKSTREIASELLGLYAGRQLHEGIAHYEDTLWQQEVEQSFPFVETLDQIETINKVKQDMESQKPMDRLVCGDVGYGKTEIALRAAFKAISSGRQVALLVPTTVLAQQHFLTFSQRLSAYPVNIEMLSRFRSKGEISTVLEGLTKGSVDICIGTHRLLQNDVAFKNLGLVIVDEEQRFGVSQKEKLKMLRQEVDVLTLTATPIPRTLHLAIAGVRDMSSIETAPQSRLPIKTYVSEFSEELIRDAIVRELDRQGQVYFLHNRVKSINNIRSILERLVPEAEIAIAHGQMPENELQEVMENFALGKIDVLLCTTIIESGLDIPNANTLIVNRADMYGLAQLYQLRGRIGRSGRRAYSYLLSPNTATISEPARNRLKTMLEATELGSGFRIAQRDLEIRGAGNILGSEQSGHIASIGFNMYTKMLSNAVEELRTKEVVSAIDVTTGNDNGSDEKLNQDTEIDLGIPANMPENYIADLSIRLEVYQRLLHTNSLEQLEDLEEELIDRFGAIPIQVANLVFLIKLKIFAKRAEIVSIIRENQKVTFWLADDSGSSKIALQKALGKNVHVGNRQINWNFENEAEEWQDSLVELLSKLIEFREKFNQFS